MAYKHNIISLIPFMPLAESLLQEAFNTKSFPNPLSADELAAAAAQHSAAAIVVYPAVPMTAEIIERLPDCVKVIATCSVGYNHIDLEAAKRRGLVVTYTPDAVTAATAECAFMLMLCASRNVHKLRSRLYAQDKTVWLSPNDMGMDLEGKSLGLIGMGRIAQAVAKRARAFDMRIHYFARNRLSVAIEQDAIYHDSLQSLCQASQIVSLHTPSTPQTFGLINKTSLTWFQSNAIFINTARGDQVVDDDLIAALKSRQLAAAGLDVFKNEPALDPRYLELDNVFITPHIGTLTTETRTKMGKDVVDGLKAGFEGIQKPTQLL